MAIQSLDTCGLKCPVPILKITVAAVKVKPGDVLDVKADCPSFETDVRDWCARSKKVLLWIKDENNAKRCQIQF